MKHFRQGPQSPVLVAALAMLFMLAACNISEEDALPPEHFTVGLVVPHQIVLGIFDNYRIEMTTLGYVEGQNVTYIQKGPPENLVDLLQMPSQLVAEEVDLIVVVSSEGALLAQGATDEIPIIFIAGEAPVEAGLANSLDKPGGNITGVMATGPEARRMELFLEIVPDMRRLFVPRSTSGVMAESSVDEIEAIADDFGLEIVWRTVRDEADMENAIQNIPDDVDGIFLPQDLLITSAIEAWSNEAITRKLPTSMPGAGQGPENDYAISGLMGYGMNVEDLAHRTARLTDQIFRGANPGDLPIESAEFYLGVNLRTANLIDVEIPDHILEQAHFIVYDEDVNEE